jgi:Ca2+-transporting ATPase
MASELGKISSLVKSAEDEITPLEKRLNHLAQKLVWVTFAIAIFTALAGIRAGKDSYLMIETSIALAVAAIPEGLPIVATMALARGMWRMSRRQALVNRLSAVETLGATSVICTDKTGTLTENCMRVVEIVLADGEDIRMEPPPPVEPPLREILEACSLCNNASIGGVGDPIEVALLEAAAAVGVLLPSHPRIGEEAFDSETKMMATAHQDGSTFRYHIKGAPESVIAACSALDADEKQHWLRRNESLAQRGLRVLAVATKASESDVESPYEDLKFLGLIGLVDPPRQDVRDAIGQCQDSGIRVVMITGDQAATAAYVADAIGLAEGIERSQVVSGGEIDSATDLTSPMVFARVSPAQKLDIIASYQREHHVVAMTGDGVNDAPALKKADIGIAMGQRGTEVAKEAADMVLKDDAFGSIVAAVEQGRTIFANIRRFVLYLMSCNLSEIIIVGLAAAVNSPLPILPLQILFLNMVTDVFPALALGMGDGHGRLMRQDPRRSDEPVLRRQDWVAIAAYSVVISAAVLTSFTLALYWLKVGTAEAVSVAFLALAGAQLLHVFNMRGRSEALLRNHITRNPFVWAALAICLALLGVALYFPAVAAILQLQPPSPAGWQLVIGASVAPLILGSLVGALSNPTPKPRSQ